MSTALVNRTIPVHSIGSRRELQAERAIARRAFRQVWIGATVCAVTFGGTFASSALTYATTFPTAAARQQLAATTSADTGLAMLLGPVGDVDTIGGYAVYKGFGFLTTIGALWALFAATRLLRGEEDAGRWQLVLAGATRPARATAATVAALLGAVGVVLAGATVLALLTARDPELDLAATDAALYGLSLAIVPAVFVAVGAVTSQLGRTRRVATGLGMIVFGLGFVLRMIADSGPDTRWLLWTTPFGWTELVAPFTTNDLRPFVPAVVTVAGLCVLAVRLAGRRDLGDGLLASRDVAAVRPFGLRSALGLSARLDRAVLGAWLAGVAASGLVLGIVAKLTTASIPGSMGDVLDKFGLQGDFARQYLGVAFLFIASMVAVLPAGQLGAARDEELSGRLVHVLAQPTARVRWFLGRLALSAGAIVVAALLGSLATWAGARSQGIELDLVTMVGAGLNVVPTALVALGIGAVVLSVAPRAAGWAVYALVGWSVLVDIVGSMVTDLGWLTRTSLFHAMALAPAQDVDPAPLVVSTAVAAILCAGAALLFRHRDLSAG